MKIKLVSIEATLSVSKEAEVQLRVLCGGTTKVTGFPVVVIEIKRWYEFLVESLGGEQDESVKNDLTQLNSLLHEAAVLELGG